MVKRNLPAAVAFVLKIGLYCALTGIFFGLFGISSPWLVRLSRTLGVTLVTYLASMLILTVAYGGFAVGRQKSKPIIYSMIMATFISDLVTHLQLSIMNTHPGNNARFVYEKPEILLLVFILQIAFIIPYTYFSNYVYFKLKDPEKCIIITSPDSNKSEIVARVKKFKKQYAVECVTTWDEPGILKKLNEFQTIFIYEVPIEQRTKIIEYCYRRRKNIYYNFEIVDIVSYGAKSVTIDDKALVMSEIRGLTIEQRIVKRIFDVIVSGLMLIVASPIMLVCAIAIKAEDGGKVYFKQKRATRDSRIFDVIKFRTMKEENSVNRSVTKDDDRITKVGKILRKFRIDELPQIFNILKGDMSVVGPRPEMLENVEKYTEELPEFTYRLRVKAGLTGYAQIAGKYNTSAYDKLIYDLLYIQDVSVKTDLMIMLQTFKVLLTKSSTEGVQGK